VRAPHATRRRLSIAAAITCFLLSILTALPAHASDPMTFVGIIGLPRLSNPEGVAVNADGDVYVAEPNVLNASTNDRLAKYTADGVFLDVLAGPGTAAGQVSDPSAVAVGPTGNVYVTQKLSTTLDRVSYFDALGNYVGSWGQWGTGNGEFKTPEGIAVDSIGNVYVADYGNDRIQEFTSSGGHINAWPAVNPTGIAVDAADVVYVAGNDQINRYDSADGSFLSQWSVSGAAGVAIDASGNAWVTTGTTIKEYDNLGSTLLGTYGSGLLFGAQGISIAPSGKVYVADSASLHGRIQRFSSAGVAEIEWGQFPGEGVPDLPNGVAVDANDDVYITKKSTDQIQEFDSDGNLIVEFGGSGNQDGKLDDPEALAVGPDGSVYVADTQNQRIQKFDASGVYVTQWGSFGTADGQVSSPAGIAVDSAGHVFVGDTANNRVQEFSTSGVFVRTWGGFGSEDGNFKSPRGIAIDASGNVWVADTANHRVQEFTSLGVYVTKFGSSSGTGALSAPTDLDLDAAGTVWVLDKTSDRVERFTASGGYLSTLGATGLDTSQFKDPAALAFDGTGRLLVADTTNHRVQVFVDQNGPDTTILGPGTASNSTSPSFTLTANDVGNPTFHCKLDAGSFAPCSSPKAYAGLTVGPHTFYAYATDTLGHDGNQTQYAWTIDTTPPVASITSKPGDPSGVSNPSFSFTSNEAGSVFQCRLDAGSFVSCVSPKSYSSLAGGSHTFHVKATDLAGNIGQEVSYTWTIDKTPPTVSITSGPTGYVQSQSASFGFTSADGGATFQCKLDGGSYATCTSPTSYSSLLGGLHTFAVRATDAFGNVGTAVSRSWTVDTATHRPDGQIATGTTYAGNDIYNTTGTNQTKTLKTAVGKTAIFKIRIQNDGSATDTFVLKGPGSASGYTVTYLYGTSDITSPVKAGTYSMSLDPAEVRVISLKVKVTSSAAASRSVLVKATSTRQSTAVDAVKAIVKRV
jgi:streptogramin lyase